MVKLSLIANFHLFIVISVIPLHSCSTDEIKYENVPSSQDKIAAAQTQNEENAGAMRPEVNPTGPAVDSSPAPSPSDAEPIAGAETVLETPAEPLAEDAPLAVPSLDSLQFTWSAGETAGLLNFRLYSKIDSAVEATLLQEVQPTALNLTAPTHSFTPSVEQLATWKGKNVCFSVKAVNGEGESAPSMETCLDFL